MAAAIFYMPQVIAGGIHCTVSSRLSGSTCDQVRNPRALPGLRSGSCRSSLHQNTGWQRRTAPHTFPHSHTKAHHLHPQRSSISEMHPDICKCIQSKKIKSKSLLCTQEVATSIQLCWISSSQTRAMDPAQVASPWFGSTSLQPARFNQAIKTESGCLDTRGAPFREWSLTDPSLKQ